MPFHPHSNYHPQIKPNEKGINSVDSFWVKPYMRGISNCKKGVIRSLHVVSNASRKIFVSSQAQKGPKIPKDLKGAAANHPMNLPKCQ
jgi:hypothetical protein